MIVPTTCFNCEAGCGLLSYVDKETMRVRKFEGNPYHPGSRGRNCAKGPATINQINDQTAYFIRCGERGTRQTANGNRVTWDERSDDIASRRSARRFDRRSVGTRSFITSDGPGHEGFIDRVLQAWGVRRA